MSFATEAIKNAFLTFGEEVRREARRNLTRGDHNVDKTLYNSLDYAYEGYKNGFRFTFTMADYGKFVDEGVKGKTSSNKAPNSPFRFGSGTGRKGGLTQGINSWVRKRRFQFRAKNGRLMTYDSTAFLITRSIYNKGTEPTYFFTKAFEQRFKNLTPKIEDAMVLSVEDLLDFVKKNN